MLISNGRLHALVPYGYQEPTGCVTLQILGEIGAGEEIRTLDPNLGKVVLYH